MLGKRKKTGDVGHIKPSTQGTSNEISFSVLHAKSNAAAQDQGSPARPAWELPQEELNARRTKRRRGRRLMAATITLAIAAAVVVVASIVVVNVQRHLDHVAYTKSVLQEVLKECDQMQPFNESISAALVQTIGTTSYSDLESQYNNARQQLGQREERLRNLKSEVEKAQQYLTLPADKEAANQGIAAINAQLNLMQMATEDMEFALPAQKAYSDAESAVSDILRANDLAKEATDLMVNMNVDSAAASKAKSEECLATLQVAEEKLQSAQKEVLALADLEETNEQLSEDEQTEEQSEAQVDEQTEEDQNSQSEVQTEAQLNNQTTEKDESQGENSEAQTETQTENQTATQTEDESNAPTEPQSGTTTNPDAVISAYLEYVELRIKAQEAAISSMQAYISRDKTTLQQANDTYNQLEAQAASLIAEQTLMPSEDISAAFNKARVPYVDQWSAELARASVACSAVRDYLA